MRWTGRRKPQPYACSPTRVSIRALPPRWAVPRTEWQPGGTGNGYGCNWSTSQPGRRETLHGPPPVARGLAHGAARGSGLSLPAASLATVPERPSPAAIPDGRKNRPNGEGEVSMAIGSEVTNFPGGLRSNSAPMCCLDADRRLERRMRRVPSLDFCPPTFFIQRPGIGSVPICVTTWVPVVGVFD